LAAPLRGETAGFSLLLDAHPAVGFDRYRMRLRREKWKRADIQKAVQSSRNLARWLSLEVIKK
jgi:hypothetical protein